MARCGLRETSIANLREALAGTAYASLEWSEERERAVDRVAASGRASVLGLSIWKAKYMLEASSYHAAHKGLVEAFLGRYRSETKEMAERCVSEALSEFLGPCCEACNGARELITENLKVTCDACGGSGLKRYSDFERARRMGLSLERTRVLSHKLGWLAGELGSLDRAVNSVMSEELER